MNFLTISSPSQRYGIFNTKPILFYIYGISFYFTLSKQKTMMEEEVHFKENDHIIIAGDSMGLFPGDR